MYTSDASRSVYRTEMEQETKSLIECYRSNLESAHGEITTCSITYMVQVSVAMGLAPYLWSHLPVSIGCKPRLASTLILCSSPVSFPDLSAIVSRHV